MRTKEEAIAAPMAGDQWWRGKSTITIDRADQQCFSWHVFGCGEDCPPVTPPDKPWLPAFRRWAAKADYLGGSQ